MDIEEIFNEILSIPSESRVLEFKRLGRDVKVSKIVETIVAMANTDGGSIILGIDDPQKTSKKGTDRVYGIEEDLTKLDEIGRDLIRITPPIASVWPPVTLQKKSLNKTIALITVPKSESQLHSIDNHVYVRLEQGNKRLTPHEIVKYSYIKGFIKADSELVDVDFELLQTDYFEKWRKSRKIEPDRIESILFQTGLAKRDSNGIMKPTRAAVMLFCLFPHNLMDTKCAIRVYQYEGTIEKMRETLNLIGTPKSIEGPIIKQIEDAHEYVLTLLRAGVNIPSSGFVTRYRLPERAVKEAITNAVIHRDYYLKRDIEIKLFEDRLEIESPGLFTYNITSYNIGFVRADGYRNDLLVKHLREFPDPPNLDRNEGVRAMRSEMDQNNLYPPIFFTYPDLNDSVRVVLFNSIKASEWDKVYNYLNKEDKYITNEIVRKIIGNPDTSKVSRILKKWVEQGLLKKVESGAKKTVKYRLPVSKDDSLFAKQ